MSAWTTNEAPKCKYAGEGCTQKVLDKDIVDHQSTCQYRPIRCMVGGCTRNTETDAGHVPYSMFLDHFRADHQGTIHCTRQSGSLRIPCIPTPTESSLRRFYQFEGHTYIISAGIYESEIRFWAWYYGPGRYSTMFRIKLTVPDPSARSMLSWEGPMNPMHMLPQDIAEQRKCLRITSDQIRQMAIATEGGNGSYFTLSWEIRNNIAWNRKRWMTQEDSGQDKPRSSLAPPPQSWLSTNVCQIQ